MWKEKIEHAIKNREKTNKNFNFIFIVLKVYWFKFNKYTKVQLNAYLLNMKNNPKKTLNEEILRIKSLFYENFNKKDFNLKGDVLDKNGLHINLDDESNVGNVSLINFHDAFDLDYDVTRFYENKEQYCKSGCEENFFNRDNSVYLHSLFVNFNHRGKGFGKEIVEKCHQIARDLGYKYVLLITNCNNDVAQNLYKGLGYQIHQTDGNKDFYFVEI